MGFKHRNSLTAPVWVAIVLLAVIAIAMLAEADADGQAGQPYADTDGRGMLAVAGQLGPQAYGLYLVDLDGGKILAYQFAQKKLRLAAVRTIEYDRRLDHYNTEPAPREIKELVDRSKQLKDIE